MSHGFSHSKPQCLKSSIKCEKMSKIPCASMIGLIMCAISYTQSNASHALSRDGNGCNIQPFDPSPTTTILGKTIGRPCFFSTELVV